jgi:hypothetical protein
MFRFLSLQWQQAQLIWNLYRTVVRAYFAAYEPDLVRERKAQRLKRKRFWAAGVNDLFAVDQHDKWLRFGLALHTGIEPFSGRILWIRVWHSNRNPQLILSYYLDTIQTLGRKYFYPISHLNSQDYFRYAYGNTKRPRY